MDYKDKIKSILRENIESVNEEAPTNPNEKEGTEKATEGDYERARAILKNDMINHAGVILRLWGSKDATKRSLFRKKLYQETNDDGGTYEFDKEEMAKLISILDNLSQEVQGTIVQHKKHKGYQKQT